MASTDSFLDAALAVTRFGLGARPGELAAAQPDPRGFLHAQITQVPDRLDGQSGGLPSSRQQFLARSAAFAPGKSTLFGPSEDELRQAGQQAKQTFSNGLKNEVVARARFAAQTPAGFRERWTLFWCNHFTVSNHSGVLPVGGFEREAIRPHIFGRFADMLAASSHHPVMLLYLNQASSMGPDSRAGSHSRKGLNENLAREIMELHTLGVDAGYTQTDVTEFARALTGWSVGGQERDRDAIGTFVFYDDMHEPGRRQIFGRAYPQSGQDQGEAALADFAASPHTAAHVAVKLARHFVADEPPPSLVARLTQSFQQSGGRLDVVAQSLIEAPEAWQPGMQKFKTPYEFLVSSWRAAGHVPETYDEIAAPMRMLGQQPLTPPSPKGWEDTTADWATPDALVKRIGWASGFAGHVPAERDPAALATEALGARLSQAVRAAIARAENRAEAIAILLMSPEFQRR